MSVLDDRIRKIARDEVGRFTAETAATGADPGTNRVAELEKQVAELTARVDELEKGTATPAPAAKRTTSRKTAETTE